MKKDTYFEQLHFENGRNINASKTIDSDYSKFMHWHPFVELLISLSPGNHVTINFTDYVLNTNDIALIHPGDLHMLDTANEPSSDNPFYIVQFPISLLTVLREFSDISTLFQQFHVIRYDPANPLSDRMIYLIKKLVDRYFVEEPFAEVHLYTLLLEFYCALGTFCLKHKNRKLRQNEQLNHNMSNLMVEACLYLSQNCTSAITLDDISRHIGLSKSHFEHMFKAYTNMTFIDYLTVERIKKAEGLIANPSMKITDIAFESGFSSVSSFNRAFKKIKQISPTEFRATQVGGR